VPFADGPPASTKQLQYLLSLIQGAGHSGFRDARRPLGLTLRQAGGKFTVGEASELIDRLLTEAGSHTSVNSATRVFGRRPPENSGPAFSGPPENRSTPQTLAESILRDRTKLGSETQSLADSRTELIRGVPAEMLADELARRGWMVVPPNDPF
jgi:hypothetical protein